MRAIAWGLGLAIASTQSSGATAAGAAHRIVERPDTTLLLVAVRLEQLDLDVTLPTYPTRDVTWVPLGALALGLDLAIQVDAAGGVAQGFVIEERRRFRLDAASDTVTVDGAPRRFDRRWIEWHHDDVYVDSRLLAEWLPLALAIDTRTATLTVRPREPLPIQRRKEREREYLRTRIGATSAVTGERLQAPYRPWDWPASDHTVYAYQRGGSFESRTGFQYTSRASGDLLYLESHGYVAGDDQDPVRDLRLSLGRRDPEPVLLGPLHAREVTVGEVLDPGLELVSLASAGTGALLSSFPLYDETEYDRRTFRGDLPPGWDVELYRNDALIGYQQSGPGGLYEFPDVPLLYGLNLFRLEFYGPQGQTRTETRTVHLGRSLTPPGRTDYRVLAHARPDGSTRAHAEMGVGFTRQLSATVRMAQLELEGRNHLYGGTGLRLGWDRLFVKADAVFDSARGSAVQTAVATRVGRIGLWAQHAWLHQFRSEVFLPTFGTILDRTGIRLDFEARSGDALRLPSSVEWRHDALARGSVDELIHQVSIARRRLGLSNRLQFRFVRLNDSSPPVERRGMLLISHGRRRLALRGAVEYSFERGGELRDVGLSAETPGFGQVVNAELRRSVLTRETSGHLSVTHGQGRLGLVLRSDLSSATGGGVSMLVTIGFDREPRTGRWNFDARPGSESGAVSAQVFIDDNDNGRRDPGESPLEGVRLRTTHAGAEARTDSTGVALLRGFPSGYETDLGLVGSSLEDPLRIPRRRDVLILPRAGTTLRVDFPVVLCGEVAGTVYVRRSGVSRPQPAANLELVTEADGRVVKRARSAFDGYYDLAAIPPGRYRLRASPPGAPRADVAPAFVTLEIGPGGPILEPVDLTLIGTTPPMAGDE